MTPLARCSGVGLAILLYAPRSLNENTCAQGGGTKLSPAASSMPKSREARRCAEASLYWRHASSTEVTVLVPTLSPAACPHV